MTTVRCAKCGEPWEAYGVETGDMEPWEAELFKQGAGCPGCKGNPTYPWTPSFVDEIPEEAHHMILAQALAYHEGTVPKWEEPPPPPPPPDGCVVDAAEPDEIMYLDASEEDLKDCGSFSYGDLHNEKVHWRNNVKCVVPRYLSGSDYSGSTVERSNKRVFMEEYGDDPHVFETYGGHGTFGVLILATCDNEEIAECLNGLHNYPLISEDDLSELEMEASNEAWENWAQCDFIRALEKQFGIDDLDPDNDITDLYELFWRAAEDANRYWESEQGGGMWINVGEVARAIDIKILEKPQAHIDPWEKETWNVRFVTTGYYNYELDMTVEGIDEETCEEYEQLALLDHMYRL